MRYLLSVFFLVLLGPGAFSQEDVKSLLGKIGAGKGIVVLAGEYGLSATDFAKNSQWTFFVQMSNKAHVDALRKGLDANGLLGNRVYVQEGTQSLYLADDLADAVLVS